MPFFCWVLVVALLVAVLGPQSFAEEVIHGSDEQQTLEAFASTGQTQIVDIEDQPFGRALRVTVAPGQNPPWGIDVQLPLPASVRAGDVLQATFFIRRLEGHDLATARVMVMRSPKSEIRIARFAVPEQWHRIDLAMKAKENVGREGSFTIALDHRPQVVEIGGLRLVNHGQEADVASLPDTALPSDYFGRDLDAAWRAEAEQRIDQHRKGDLTVIVQDTQGNPVPEANVNVEMQKHAFRFGTVVNPSFITAPQAHGIDADLYVNHLQRLFNYATIGTFKWPAWSGGWGEHRDADDTLAAARWLKEQGFPVRGHVLVYSGWGRQPKPIKELAQTDPAAAEQKLREHIAEVVTQSRGLVDVWDVVNEARGNEGFYASIGGQQPLVEWFKLVDQLDPEAMLLYNENSILDPRGRIIMDNRPRLKREIQWLLDQGAPVEAIGLQSHFKGMNTTSPEELVIVLDYMGELGLPIESSEYDIPTGYEDDPNEQGGDDRSGSPEEEQLQADYTRDFYTALFSHPSVMAITPWGFWEKAHWKPSAAMFRTSWAPKPSADVYQDLLFKDWWTHEQGQTDAQGRYRTRAFLGDYKITADRGGQPQTVLTTLNGDGTTVHVTVE